jgi:hypothetical protein
LPQLPSMEKFTARGCVVLRQSGRRDPGFLAFI